MVVGTPFTCPRARGVSSSDIMVRRESFYPFLWRAMKVGEYHLSLKNGHFDYKHMGPYYLLNFHTELAEAMRFRAYLQAQMDVPSASDSRSMAKDYCDLVGASFKKQSLLEACANRSANISPRNRVAPDAINALHRGTNHRATWPRVRGPGRV